MQGNRISEELRPHVKRHMPYQAVRVVQRYHDPNDALPLPVVRRGPNSEETVYPRSRLPILQSRLTLSMDRKQARWRNII